MEESEVFLLGKKDLTVEVAVNLGHVEVVHTVGMEQLFVRRCRMIPNSAKVFWSVMPGMS